MRMERLERMDTKKVLKIRLCLCALDADPLKEGA